MSNTKKVKRKIPEMKVQLINIYKAKFRSKDHPDYDVPEVFFSDPDVCELYADDVHHVSAFRADYGHIYAATRGGQVERVVMVGDLFHEFVGEVFNGHVECGHCELVADHLRDEDMIELITILCGAYRKKVKG